MLPPPFVIRTPETAADYEAFFSTLSFANNPDLAEADLAYTAREGYARFQGWSHVVPSVLRGAFRGTECLGTYQIDERWLNLGSVQIRTGCIGYVATHPAFQRQGIATRLMQDALAYARQQDYSLLLLVGIPHFYQRFGFTNIMDYPIQTIALSDLATQPASPYVVREATEHDSAAMLALYQSQYHRFDRSIDLQDYQLRGRLSPYPPFIAFDMHNHPQGYILLPEQHELGRASEVAATDWAAALALLHYHATLLNTLPEPPSTIRWPLPFDTVLAYETMDHLQVTWEIMCVPDGGWMASIVDLPTFIQLLMPLWQQRWQRHPHIRAGRVTQVIGDYVFSLDITDEGICLLDTVQMDAPIIRLSPSVFTKLVFGCRPITWAVRQADIHIPEELASLAEIFYPTERVWFPLSDEF